MAQHKKCNDTYYGLTVAYYCPRSCGLCAARSGPSCLFLAGICGAYGTCSTITYFGVSTIQCTCNNNYFGAGCTRGNF